MLRTRPIKTWVRLAPGPWHKVRTVVGLSYRFECRSFVDMSEPGLRRVHREPPDNLCPHCVAAPADKERVRIER